MNREFNKIIDEICEKDSRYKHGAYEFIMEALTYTQRRHARAKHVTGDELLECSKELLIEKFGPMTIKVLDHWGINNTEDFGNIVFNLVENKVLSKTEDDRLEHFQDRFDFDEVFNKSYRKKLHKKISRLR